MIIFDKRGFSSRHFRRFSLLGLCVLTLMVAVQPAFGDVNWFDRPSFIQAPVTQLNQIDIGSIYLDGRPVFSITAPRPSLENEQEAPISPINERVKLVHRQLKAIAESTLDDDEVKINYKYDVATGVVSINDQYLLTLTSNDAKLYGSTVSSYSSLIRTSLTDALKAYYRERQSSYLKHKALIVMTLMATAALFLWGLKRLQKYVDATRVKALSQFDVKESRPLEVSGELSEADQAQIIEREQKNKRQREEVSRINFKADLWRLSSRILAVVVGIGFIAYALSLFPQSRWIQSLLLSNLFLTLIKLSGLAIVSYLLIRLSLLGIDYGYGLLSTGHRLSSWYPVRSLLRLQTFRTYSRSVVVFLLTLITVLLALEILGLDLAPLLAGAGLLGLAITFGAQDLIKDVINGLFLLWEDQYGLGDVISVNGVTGLVESMNLRMTQLRSQDGDLISIPNGNIELVKNHSNQWSRANLAIEVAYQTDIDEAIAVIQKTAMSLRYDPAWRRDILEDPQVLGVDDLGENSITIRLWIKTKPLRQWDVSREFRQRIKVAFDQADISIPFPQRSLWFQNSPESPNL